MYLSIAIPAALLAAMAASGPAFSSASDWHEVEGASLRIVTSGEPDDAGVLRGALEIHLKPGWKTYWRDPGDSGVPPTLTAAEPTPAGIEMDFPQPKRFDDGYSLWAGYDRSVSFALTFDTAASAPSSPIDIDAFLGICEDICIPVQAKLAVDPESAPADPEHAAIVASAFAGLPGPARPGFEARTASVADDVLTVEATLPEGVEAVDLFVAGSKSVTLGTPEREKGDAAVRFAIPITGQSGGGAAEPLPYTLVTTAGAVSGKIDLP